MVLFLRRCVRLPDEMVKSESPSRGVEIGPRGGKRIPGSRHMDAQGRMVWRYADDQSAADEPATRHREFIEDLPPQHTFKDFGRAAFENIPDSEVYFVDDSFLMPRVPKNLPDAERDRLERQYLDAFRWATSTAPERGKVVHDCLGRNVVVSDQFFRDHNGKTKVLKRDRAEFVRFLMLALKDPHEVWEVSGRNERGEPVTRSRYIMPAFTRGRRRGVILVADIQGNYLTGVSAYASKSAANIDQQRRGVRMLYPKRKREG